MTSEAPKEYCHPRSPWISHAASHHTSPTQWLFGSTCNVQLHQSVDPLSSPMGPVSRSPWLQTWSNGDESHKGKLVIRGCPSTTWLSLGSSGNCSVGKVDETHPNTKRQVFSPSCYIHIHMNFNNRACLPWLGVCCHLLGLRIKT